MAGSTEGGWSGFWDSASNMTACAAGGMAAYGIGTAYVSTTNPIGWTYWAVTGVIGL
ncbi:MAG: hypothetical protein HUJ96_07995 [Marinilabiliaceae bacterium]|nr:hypothetical protein [Marinilabiliaceae bacterium]